MAYPDTVFKGGASAGTSPVLRVAVCGEVNSGKSTVLNALLRARILPDNIGSSSRPVVFASYRAERGVDVQYRDGTHLSTTSADRHDILRNAEFVWVASDHEHLAGIEIVEVPLTKADELTEEQIALIRASDVMIWVTIASQAWRLTEKNIVERLGDARPAHGILAVTRADKLRNDRDRQRLRERVVRETQHFFADCIFLNGERKKIDKAATSDDAWADTGGAAITARLHEIGEQLLAEAALRPPAPPEPKAPPAPPPRQINTEAVPAVLDGLPGALVAGISPLDSPESYQALMGDAAQVRELGALCRQSFGALTNAFPAEGTGGPVSSLSLSTGGHRVLLQDVPETGLVFLMVDAQVMSQGNAQRAIMHLCNAL